MKRKRYGAALLAALLLAANSLAAQAQKPIETETAQAPPERAWVTVPAGTHLPLVLQNTIHTRSAKVGDQAYFETVYPVTVDNRVLIPAGSFVRGSLTQVKRSGRVKGRAQIFVRFDSLTLPNGYTLPLSATVRSAQGGGEEKANRKEGTVTSEGSKGHDVGTVASTTATGAIIGAAAGQSGKGAAIGAGAGAAAGLIGVLLTRGKEVELPRGSTVDVVLDRDLNLEASMVQFDSTGRATTLAGPTPADRRETDFPRRRWPF